MSSSMPSQAEIAILVHKLQTVQGGTGLVEQKIVETLNNTVEAADNIYTAYQIGTTLWNYQAAERAMDKIHILARDGGGIVIGAAAATLVKNPIGKLTLAEAASELWGSYYDFVASRWGLTRQADGTYHYNNANMTPLTVVNGKFYLHGAPLTGSDMTNFFQNRGYYQNKFTPQDTQTTITFYDDGKGCLINLPGYDTYRIREVNGTDIRQRLNAKLQPTDTISVYVVQSGDSLSQIAQRNATTLSALQAINPQITNPDKILVGERIAIPLTTNGNAVTLVNNTGQTGLFNTYDMQTGNLLAGSTWVADGQGNRVLQSLSNGSNQTWQAGSALTDGIKIPRTVASQLFNGYLGEALAAATVSLPQRAYLQLTDASGSVTGSQTFTQSAPDANTRVIRNAAGQITSDGTVTTSLSNNRLSAVVDTQLGGHNVRVLYSEDSHGDLVASKLVSYDGKTPANATGFLGALTTQKISPWDLAANHPGEAPAALGDASGNPIEPTPENLLKANDPAKPGTGDTLQNSLTSISEVLGREWLHTNSAKGTVWRIAA